MMLGFRGLWAELRIIPPPLPKGRQHARRAPKVTRHAAAAPFGPRRRPRRRFCRLAALQRLPAGHYRHDTSFACRLDGLDAGGRIQRARHRRGPNRKSLASAALFIRFLRERRLLPQPVTQQSAADLWPILGEFRSWMRQHRGLTDASLDVYEGILVGLLDKLGDKPQSYTAEALRGFVLERARRHRIARAKS